MVLIKSWADASRLAGITAEIDSLIQGDNDFMNEPWQILKAQEREKQAERDRADRDSKDLEMQRTRDDVIMRLRWAKQETISLKRSNDSLEASANRTARLLEESESNRVKILEENESLKQQVQNLSKQVATLEGSEKLMDAMRVAAGTFLEFFAKPDPQK
jgi:hypothetical protein